MPGHPILQFLINEPEIMAIPPTEIRYRKSMAYFILVVSGSLFITMPVTLLSSGGTKAAPMAYLICVVSMIVLFYLSRGLYRKASSRNPVLIFTSDGLQIPMKNNQFIPWGEITQWKIKRYKSSHALIIYTPGNKTKVDISWLDLPAKEIERLMSTYIRKPGPHGFLR